MWSRRIDRSASGRVRLRLSEPERALLRQLPHELTALLEADPEDPSLRRLFPPAYEDAADAAEFRRLMHGELSQGRRDALRLLAESADRDELDIAEAQAWLTALNDLRLVLGTRLDVQEETLLELDPADPEAPDLALYGYLSALLEELVNALGADLPA